MPRSAIKIIFAAVIAVLCCARRGWATQYTVGDRLGWVPNHDYTRWINGRTFAVGDVLIFMYEKGHDVAEVSQDGWFECRAENPLFYSKNMDSYVPLERVGEHYFISTGPGDCHAGMNLKINVA
ncbi:BLUE COPPER PROTEIN [Salix viminalis]|uniref:BLUE COPPER PROTEIN n=1 Tax=Salix viminalis TaxID=40686 RepID=A0A9Q0NND6_SALVM|nr:BLUE COPPER PROTEIN [Salix viminalis]